MIARDGHSMVVGNSQVTTSLRTIADVNPLHHTVRRGGDRAFGVAGLGSGIKRGEVGP